MVKGDRDRPKSWAWAMCPRNGVVSSRFFHTCIQSILGRPCVIGASPTFPRCYGPSEWGPKRCSCRLMPWALPHVMPSLLLPTVSAPPGLSFSQGSPCVWLCFSICLCDSVSGLAISLNLDGSHSVSLCLQGLSLTLDKPLCHSNVFMLRFEGHGSFRTGRREETGLSQGGETGCPRCSMDCSVPSWTQSASG